MEINDQSVETSRFAEAKTRSISNLHSSPRRVVIGQGMMDNRLIILALFFFFLSHWFPPSCYDGRSHLSDFPECRATAVNAINSAHTRKHTHTHTHTHTYTHTHKHTHTHTHRGMERRRRTNIKVYDYFSIRGSAPCQLSGF
ncbi:unnamed protein product [Gadus morhua 'NCC']